MYAKGKKAVAICQRSGEKILYSKLVPDGDSPGLMVSPEWRDISHPAKRPVRTVEGVSLRRPAVDTDNDSDEPVAGSLATNLFAGQNIFGGGT